MNSSSRRQKKKSSGPLKRFFQAFGPGVITGAADDDPSGVATYSIAGASTGTSLLWTATLTWPLMWAVQVMCAQIGLVTGEGLAANLRKKLPRGLVLAFVGALLVANTINIAADLAGMAEAAQILTGIRDGWFIVVLGVAIGGGTILMKYSTIARILKWLALALFAYVITAFRLAPPWKAILHNGLVPALPKGKEAWALLVAILGTTISPYLFFWQTSEEVEEEKEAGETSLAKRRGATRRAIFDRAMDVGTGTFFSNLVMFFIILTTALTLHDHGITHIETSGDAARALEPLAGSFATALYCCGLVGVGLLAIPTLAGSVAYAFADVFKWRQGLDRKARRAPAFYSIIAFCTLAGIAMNLAGVSAMAALYWSAVVNGLLAPILLVGVLLVASDKKLMQGQPNTPWLRITVGFTTLLMFGAGIGMFVF